MTGSSPRSPIHRAGAIALLAITAGCATLAPGRGPVLNEEIEEVLSEPPLDQVNWGIRVVDPDRGRILFNRHGHLKFVPASNMKILTTATAISLLGPGYRYRTTLWGVGARPADGPILEGDLLLAATGDPTFSERFYPSAETPLDSLAESVWESGIRTVTGALVVDVSRWDSTSVPGTWEVDDLPATYAATGGAFSIGEGILSVEVRAGPGEGTPASVRWWPHVPDELLSVGFVTVPVSDSARLEREVSYYPESGRLRIMGKIPEGEVDTVRIAQRSPVSIASINLLNALQRRGIDVRGGVRIAWDPEEPVGGGDCVTGGMLEPASLLTRIPVDTDALAPQGVRGELSRCPGALLLGQLFSPPMVEIVQAILEPSQNWMAEQLVRTLGAETGERGGWREGLRIEEEFLTQEAGIDSLDLFLRDGSGLSAKNLVTPRAMVRLLDYMRSSSNGDLFRAALASPGEEDSTLEDRLQGLEGQVFAKTGTITHVASLSGYLYTRSGRVLIFSILTNGTGLPSRVVRSGIDRIVEVLYRH